MHSFGFRFNTIVTVASFLLATLWTLSSLSDRFNVPNVNSHVEVVKVNRFRKQLNGNDEVSLTFNISMDLRSTFTWNTKQEARNNMVPRNLQGRRADTRGKQAEAAKSRTGGADNTWQSVGKGGKTLPSKDGDNGSTSNPGHIHDENDGQQEKSQEIEDSLQGKHIEKRQDNRTQEDENDQHHNMSETEQSLLAADTQQQLNGLVNDGTVASPRMPTQMATQAADAQLEQSVHVGIPLCTSQLRSGASQTRVHGGCAHEPSHGQRHKPNAQSGADVLAKAVNTLQQVREGENSEGASQTVGVSPLQTQAFATRDPILDRDAHKQAFVFITAEYQSDKNSLNQVSLWDHIILGKEHANFQLQTLTKYLLIDQGSNLRGKQIELVLHWYVMPRVGKIFEDKMVVSDFRLPEAYT